VTSRKNSQLLGGKTDNTDLPIAAIYQHTISSSIWYNSRWQGSSLEEVNSARLWLWSWAPQPRREKLKEYLRMEAGWNFKTTATGNNHSGFTAWSAPNAAGNSPRKTGIS